MSGLAHLPERAAAIFDTWIGPGERSSKRTAELLGMSMVTVNNVAGRYGFSELARDLDREELQHRVARTRAQLAESLPSAVQTLVASMAVTIGENGKPLPGSPSQVALKSALAVLAVHGISPLTRQQVGLVTQELGTNSLGDGGLDAEVAQALASGDTATLIALAAGGTRTRHPAPYPVPGMPPQDFTSAQPGGRVGSDPPSPLVQDLDVMDGEAVDATYRVLSPKEWDEQQRRGELVENMDFDFGEQPGD